MPRLVVSACLAASLAAIVPASCRTPGQLVADGFLVRRILSVDGDFHGCGVRRPVRFVGGSDFLCQSDSFTYLHDPLAFVLQNPATLETVLSIGGVEYAGRLENVARVGRRIDTGTGPLLTAMPDPMRLMPLEAGIATQGIAAISGLDQPVPAGHDDGTPQRR